MQFQTYVMTAFALMASASALQYSPEPGLRVTRRGGDEVMESREMQGNPRFRPVNYTYIRPAPMQARDSDNVGDTTGSGQTVNASGKNFGDIDASGDANDPTTKAASKGSSSSSNSKAQTSGQQQQKSSTPSTGSKGSSQDESHAGQYGPMDGKKHHPHYRIGTTVQGGGYGGYGGYPPMMNKNSARDLSDDEVVYVMRRDTNFASNEGTGQTTDISNQNVGDVDISGKTGGSSTPSSKQTASKAKTTGKTTSTGSKTKKMSAKGQKAMKQALEKYEKAVKKAQADLKTAEKAAMKQ